MTAETFVWAGLFPIVALLAVLFWIEFAQWLNRKWPGRRKGRPIDWEGER